MTLREALKKGEAYLAQQGVPDAAVDAWYLMEHVLTDNYGERVNRAWYFVHQDEEMLATQYTRYQTLLNDRARRRPLQHITGKQEFMGLSFLVNDKVLIPRQDTEILVEEALKELRPGMCVLDMCTGSGCIIISLVKLTDEICGTASDVSEEALDTAKENARNHGVCIDFRQGDLFTPIDGSYDMIVSNPPYIPTGEIDKLMKEVRLYDPLGALDGKEDGLYFYRKIITQSSVFLKKNGWLIVEIGYDQGRSVSDMMKNGNFTDISVIKDLAGLDRVVKARKI